MATNTNKTFMVMLSYASIIAFTAALIFCIVRINQVSVELDKRSYDTSWALMQLQHELDRFLSTVELYHSNRIQKEVLTLRYDILWSRLPVLMAGKLKESINQQYKVARIIERIYDRVVELETSVIQLTPNSPDYVRVLIALAPLRDPLSKSIASTFQGNALIKGSMDIRLSSLRNALMAVIAGLLTSISFLMYLTHMERRESFLTSHLDKLTGLKNRHALLEEMYDLSNKDQYYSLILVDVRDFSIVNSRFGSHVGDIILKEIATRLETQYCNKDEKIARIGGDEFAVIKTGIVKISEVREYAKEIKRLVNKKITAHEHAIQMEPAIGIAYYPSDADTPTELISRAEAAITLCKTQNNDYAIFDRSFIKEMHRRKRIAQELNDAIDANFIEPYYQPIIDIQTGKCVSAEALVRWRHHEMGLIPAGELIDIAEEYELGTKLGASLLKSICKQIVEWREMGFNDLQIAFNVSPKMYKRSLLNLVAETLVETGVPTRNLVLEITENTSIQEVETSLHLMGDLNRQGIELALDDFGMGYSSLSYLQKLPITRLKLDRTFVTHVADSEEAEKFYCNIMQMAQILGKKIICEGIESLRQLEVIQKSGIPAYAQGYLLSRPLCASDFTESLKTKNDWRPTLDPDQTD